MEKHTTGNLFGWNPVVQVAKLYMKMPCIFIFVNNVEQDKSFGFRCFIRLFLNLLRQRRKVILFIMFLFLLENYSGYFITKNVTCFTTFIER